MIFIICKTCGFVLRISPGQEGEAESLFGRTSEWYPDRYPCARCDGTAELQATVEGPFATPVDVSPGEALACLNGLGLPSERDCHGAYVSELLTSKRVTKVVTRSIPGARRCVIDHIDLEDGTKVYFGASTFGATVYRVTPPFSYVELLRNE